MSSKTFVMVAVIAGLGFAAAYFYMPSSELTIEADNSSTLVTDDQLAPSSLPGMPVVLPETIAEPPELPTESSLLELETALASTIFKREDIEEALRVVELKVGALEAQLDNIELRGDNPADVQDETLGSFQAIFAEYQDQFMAFEQIKAKEVWLENRIKDLKK